MIRFGTKNLSENRPIRRNLAEKEKQLRDLKNVLEHLKPQTLPSLRKSIERKISELNHDILNASQRKRPSPITSTSHKIYALHSD